MPKTKPNFIFIMTDQHRADLRASRGCPLDTMPFLDSFAKGSADFERAYTPNPICLAARVSFLTGRTPETHKVRTNHNARDAVYYKDMLDILSENGYQTALCGKNHTHRKNSDFDFAKTNGHLGSEGEINSTPAEKEFAEFLKATHHMEVDHPSPGGVEVQFPYRNVRDALEFIDRRDREKPFFLWVSMAEPHNPSQVPKPYFDMFPPEALPKVTGKEALEGKSERFLWLRSIWERIMGKDIDKRMARTRSNYFGMLRLIDDQIKRLIDGVEQRGLTGETHIVFLSDHGDLVGEYGILRKGADLAEPLINIPFIWRGPEVVSGRRAECVNLIDVLPTICDIIGVPIPDGVQGKSILPLLHGEEVNKKEFESAFSESGYGGLFWDERDALAPDIEGACDKDYTHFDCLDTWTQCGMLRAVRKGDYKVIMDSRGNGWLYNVSADPLELHDLWNGPAFESVKCDMLAELSKQMMLHTDPLPYPHHRYRVKRHPKNYTESGYISPDPGVSQLKDYKGHNT